MRGLEIWSYVSEELIILTIIYERSKQMKTNEIEIARGEILIYQLLLLIMIGAIIFLQTLVIISVGV